MDSKKLQQMQQANSHLAPMVQHPHGQMKPGSYHGQTSDYRPQQSPVFQNQTQYQGVQSNFAQMVGHTSGPMGHHSTVRQVNPHGHAQVIGSNTAPLIGSGHLHVKPLHSGHVQINQSIGYPQHQQPASQPVEHYHGNVEQLYQNNRERLYQQSHRPSSDNIHQQPIHSHRTQQQNYPQVNPVTTLQQQYQQLQHAKMQQQIQTQNEALVQQQRTFALRQQLNPPVPQSHFHIQSQSMQSMQSGHHSQYQSRNIPPSSLNLTSQFQPAVGPLQLSQPDEIYGHTNQQITSPEQTPIIKPNQPGMVAHQACQTQSSGSGEQPVITSITKTPTSSTDSPTHAPLDRKKSSGSIQAIKSPLTKRPPAAPVTISGWLYKQGSEGLKVWRKRWFVLAEYCLYYYKGPEEDKLLGSILLPSYQVGACSPDDRINRKYSFKCEHQNMRTYWLAAENADAMGQWVRALTAATMMQGSSDTSDHTSQPSVASSLNPSGDNSDSGIHTYQSQQSRLNVHGQHGPVTPASADSGNGGGSGGGTGGAQPLYANAPPKPRRVNDGGYSSPSPENSIDRYESNYGTRPQNIPHQNDPQAMVSRQYPNDMQQTPSESIYEVRPRQTGKPSTDSLSNRLHQIRLENNMSPNPSTSRIQTNSPYHHHQYDSNQLLPSEAYPVADHIIRAPQHFDDYVAITKPYNEPEDIYMQRLQMSQKYQSHPNEFTDRTTANTVMIAAERRTPDAYGRSRPGDGPTGTGRQFGDYEDVYNAGVQHQMYLNEMQAEAAYRRPLSPPTYKETKTHPVMPARFTPSHLDTDQVQQHVHMRARPLQPTIPRPHSADFLEYEARHPETAGRLPMEVCRAPRPKSSLDINRSHPDNYYYSEASYAEKMRQSALYLQNNSPSSVGKIRLDESMKRHSDYLNDNILTTPSISSTPYVTAGSISTMPLPSREPEYRPDDRNVAQTATTPTGRIHRSRHSAAQQEQFLRSASARLPRVKDDDGRDGERKREESMKRLLEWKQRMLQSPLTRKGVPISTAMDAKSPMRLMQQSKHCSGGEFGPGIQRSRSDVHANTAGYNSYSSDDEASISVRNVHKANKIHPTNGPILSATNDGHHHQRAASMDLIANSNNPFLNSDLSYYSDKYVNDSSIVLPTFEPDDIYAIQQQHQHKQQHRSMKNLTNIDRESSNNTGGIKTLDMSAGDLLSRTHEELVLLLIQLRRQNTATARGIEQCCTDIHDVKNRIRTSDGQTRADHLTRLDTLKQQLVYLEKQYEKSKPLVNLVDNMVKLGSLYRNGAPTTPNGNRQMDPGTIDRIEFNQRNQERRLLQEEQKHWDRMDPSHSELQSKVQQLYQLDQLLQEESGTLQSLQRDKEDLERALTSLRKRLQDGRGPPLALEAARKQQHALERELSRVHQMLAENSKKLEQTVAGNARLEQELLVLRQKLQSTRGSRGSQSAFGSQSGPDSLPFIGGATAVLESELRRVQDLVGDMQRQRQELSQAVRQLTENSNHLYQQIDSRQQSHQIKKRLHSTGWTETDLDSMKSYDHGLNSSADNISRTDLNISNSSTTPLYIDTGSANSSINLFNKVSDMSMTQKALGLHRQQESDGIESSGMESDDLPEGFTFGNLSIQDKQEIKTVRIVKRESERRQRDRERHSGPTAVSIQNLDQVMEEEAALIEEYNRSKSLPRTYMDHEPYAQIQHNQRKSEPINQKPIPNNYNSLRYSSGIPVNYTDYYNKYSSDHRTGMADEQVNSKNLINMVYRSGYPNEGQRINKTESIQSLTKVMGEINPIFQSEAAKQIIIEMSGSGDDALHEPVQLKHSATGHKHRRAIPKEKRRHYTAPNTLNPKELDTIQSENDMNKNNINWRARDDLDMEVALRPRINAPDVVRSALGQRERISENTIDKLLSAPSKILIPERYIPEQAPELSPEEKRRRQEKVEAIKKMLSEGPMNDAPSLPPAEKKQREHLLQLNQILAQQVMQMSKIVAEKAMQEIQPNDQKGGYTRISSSEDDQSSSPIEPLPIYQQRDNYFT